MPTYIALARYTHQGIQNVKQSPGRVDATKQAFRQAGAELKAFYLTTGRYDMVTIIEAPNDEAMARMALALGAQGNIRTETMRAFEPRKIGGEGVLVISEYERIPRIRIAEVQRPGGNLERSNSALQTIRSVCSRNSLRV